jgi:hypothetical protein
MRLLGREKDRIKKIEFEKFPICFCIKGVVAFRSNSKNFFFFQPIS